MNKTYIILVVLVVLSVAAFAVASDRSSTGFKVFRTVKKVNSAHGKKTKAQREHQKKLKMSKAAQQELADFEAEAENVFAELFNLVKNQIEKKLNSKTGFSVLSDKKGKPYDPQRAARNELRAKVDKCKQRCNLLPCPERFCYKVRSLFTREATTTNPIILFIVI